MDYRPNLDGIEGMFQDIAANIEQADRQLRASYTGKPLNEIKAAAASKLGGIGVSVPDEKLTEYAQSIVDNEPFEFVLQ